MGSLCFSSASILRCESFTTLESQLVIIPTALELIFSTTLIFSNWGKGRNLLLTAEGWSYFALALLELLSHNIPAVRDSVTVFSVVDIVLGATSFLPIFFYTLFVYLFTRAELIAALPKSFRRISNVLLVVFIPAVIALNELSSFIGISRRTINLTNGPVVAIGFRTFNDQQLWTFLTSLTLALLTAFQAINFCFAFYRLVRAWVDQRRIETTSSDEAHLIRGVGWMTGGLKLGAVETVIGFAQGGFGGALTRRILRFLSRAFLIIGVVKGMDRVDDFEIVQAELKGGRRAHYTKSRLMIGNPRFSTFRQMTPTAGEFYSAPRAVPEKAMLSDEKADFYSYDEKAGRRQSLPQGPTIVDFEQLRRQATLTTINSVSTDTSLSYAAARPRGRERVTIHHDGSNAPTLEMRFSGLDMPSPAVIAESVKARPVSSSWVSVARSSRYAPSSVPDFAFDPVAPPVPAAYPEFIYDRGDTVISPSVPPSTRPPRHNRAVSDYSTRRSQFSTRSSVYPESIRGIAAQFPPTPITERAPGVDHNAPQASVTGLRAPRQLQNPFDSGATPEPSPVALRYTYGGLEHHESSPEEHEFRYAYDGPEHVHPYAAAYSPPVVNPDSPAPVSHSPPAERHMSDTTATMTATGMTSLSRFTPRESLDTPGTSSSQNPFRYDDDKLAYAADAYTSPVAYITRPVRFEDGSRSDEDNDGYARTSVALLQMTQKETEWTTAEFTPTMLMSSAPPSATSTSTRHTLKKKRPANANNKGKGKMPMPMTSMESLASGSSWLQDDPEAYADDEHTASVPLPVSVTHVKSVGRVKAPRKAVPAPITARHGMTRGSVYIQPIHVPPSEFSSEVQIVQGGSSADSYQSEFAVERMV